MKCHYDILEVDRNASDDVIKKAYRKLALKWHPDKNLDNPVEAKEQFQLVQQAWEVLSDPHERTWYDNHREAILKGGIGENYKDESINLFQYFSTTCYKGYGDDDNGFYTVYRKVFETLAAEDAEFSRDGGSEDIASFGNSESSYEEVVHHFYAYWQSYSTKRSFAWLDPYDIRDTPNRRVLRLVEKENRKIREKAKRERNEQVRNLVAFIRKRDKRVQAYAAKLAERARDNFRKTEERRKAQLLERQRLLRDHTESEWSKFSNIEAQLKNIEANLAAEFGEELSSNEDAESDENGVNDMLYCVACNKIFKTHKAFGNHENSRKHKENVGILKASMTEDDKNSNDSSLESNSSIASSNSSIASTNSSTESSSLNKPRLATDSQMPDFLLNPPRSDVGRPDNKDNEDISPDEFISDNEESSTHHRPANEKKKSGGEGVSLAESPQMDDSFSFPSRSEIKDGDALTSEDELISDQEEEIASSRQKKKKKKRNVRNPHLVLNYVSDNDTESINEDLGLSKKQRKKLQQRKAAVTKSTRNDEEIHDEKQQNSEDGSDVREAKLDNVDENQQFRADKTKKGRKKERREKNKKDPIVDTDDLAHRCVSCSTEFPSKNKLFEHLKKTGHSVHIPEAFKNKTNQNKTPKDLNNLEKKKKH